MDRLILVGRVAGAFGVRGEIKITTYTDEPASLLRYRALKTEAGALALTLTSGRAHNGLALYAPRSAFPAPDEDEFYLADLIGLTVVTPEGAELGVVKSAQNFGAGDLLEIAPPGAATWYLPFTKDAVPEVRIADGLIVAVRPTETE